MIISFPTRVWRWITFASYRERVDAARTRSEAGLAEVQQHARDVLQDEIDRGLAGFDRDAR